MVQEQNFQPQGRDTSNGPHLHTYIPRADGSITIGGVAYVPQVPTTAAVAMATSIPIVVQAGGEALVQHPQPPPIMPATAVPLVYQQPTYHPHLHQTPAPQPAYAPYAPYAPYGTYPAPQQPAVPGYPTYHVQQPAVGTYGLTGNEVMARQLAMAQGLEMNKKQEMKPADDDPFRMYWCRELDGTWTQRNRLTIDSGDIGDCRWYTMEGQFYAVRLPS